MKFRGVITDCVCMKEFYNILLMFSKISKDITCIIKSNEMEFIIRENINSSIPWMWSELPKKEYFTEYNLQGMEMNATATSDDDVDNDYQLKNQIILTFNAIKFASALIILNKGAAVRYVKIKLTNKQFPCLTIDLEIVPPNSVQSRKVTHDIPVTIIPIRDWNDFNKNFVIPVLMPSIEMPTIRSIKILVDKIKNLSPTTTIYLNTNGELSFVLETDTVTVASHYRNLQFNNSTATTNLIMNTKEFIEKSCRISSKQLAMVFHSFPMQTCTVICNIDQDELLKFQFQIRKNVFIDCILMAVSL